MRKKATLREEYMDFKQFSVEIDLGICHPIDPSEDQVRKRKEEEERKEMQRQEADFNKMMKRKKLDN